MTILSEKLGALLELIDTGTARVSFRVTQNYTNGHGFCHGGIMFTLADGTLGLAYNSYSVKAVAQVAILLISLLSKKLKC